MMAFQNRHITRDLQETIKQVVYTLITIKSEKNQYFGASRRDIEKVNFKPGASQKQKHAGPSIFSSYMIVNTTKNGKFDSVSTKKRNFIRFTPHYHLYKNGPGGYSPFKRFDILMIGIHVYACLCIYVEFIVYRLTSSLLTTTLTLHHTVNH